MMRFEFTKEELERLVEFMKNRGIYFDVYYDDYDERLLQKLRNYISQAEALEEVIVLRDIPLEEAIHLINEYVGKNENCLTNDIVMDLELDPGLVLTALKELSAQGIIEPRPILEEAEG